MYFIHPHTHWNTRTAAHHTHTHTHRGANTLTGDSPHYCFLTSYLLHLCNIHLSLLTGPGSSIYPFYLYPRSVSPHRYSQLQPPPPAELTLVFRAFWKTGTEYYACEWRLLRCGVLKACQTLGTGAVKHWSVIIVSKDSMWWIVKEDSAQDAVWWRIT